MDFKRMYVLPVIVMGLCFWLISCSSKSLKDQRAQQEIEYMLEPGTQVAVSNGVVTFTGTFPDEASMREAETTARSMKGIKSVVNKATVAPKIHTATDTTSMAN